MNLFIKNKGFFIPYLLYLIAGLVFILLYTEAEILHFIVSLRTPALTDFMQWFTHIGDGFFFLFTIIVLLLFFRLRYGVTALAAWLIQGAITQTGKNFIFNEYSRPAERLKDNFQDFLIEGFDHHYFHSFPSGHASSSFCMFLILALFTRNKKLGFLFFIFALSVAFTRPYLAQHFFIDIYVGGIIGSLAAVVAYKFVFKPDTAHNNKWLDRKVISGKY